MSQSLSGVLTIGGTIVDDNVIRSKFQEKYQNLLSKLTIRTHIKIGGFDKLTKVYKYSIVGGQKCMHLPRNTSELLYDSDIIESLANCIPDGRVTEFKFAGELFDNQTLTIKHLMSEVFSEKRCADGFGTCVLNMAAGLGKTFTAAGLITEVRRNTLYVVMREKLQQQAYDDLRICFPDAKIAATDGSKYADTYAASYDIVIMVINSALGMPESFFNMFGFIIFDEIHMYASKSRAEIFWKCQVRCVLGMSGTTAERGDGLDAVYYKHLGKPLMASSIPGYVTADANYDGRIKVIKYYGMKSHTRKVISDATGYVDFDGMLEQFITDPHRNKICVDEIMELYDATDAKRIIFAFSDRIEHLKTIAAMITAVLTQRNRADNKANLDDLFVPELVTMQGGSTDLELRRANSARIILTTYIYGGTGISIQHANSVVMMTPRRKGHKQFLSRVLRRGSDIAIVRWFIDIVDSRTTIANQYTERSATYREFDFKVHLTKTIKYNESDGTLTTTEEKLDINDTTDDTTMPDID